VGDGKSGRLIHPEFYASTTAPTGLCSHTASETRTGGRVGSCGARGRGGAIQSPRAPSQLAASDDKPAVPAGTAMMGRP
jgi:hypothetical protein